MDLLAQLTDEMRDKKYKDMVDELSKLSTVEEIVDDLIAHRFSPEDAEKFKSFTDDEVCLQHHELGRWIRNTYGLWLTNKLTEQWRLDPRTHDIRGGIDFSLDHPDHVSTVIMNALREKLKAA